MDPSTGLITWLGHSCVRLTLPDGRVIFIDPWLNDNPSCPADARRPDRCDFIVATHAHFDHVGAIADLAQRFRPKVIAIYELATLFSKHAPGAECLGMNLGGTQQVDGVKFSLTRAYHSSGFQVGDMIHYAGMPAGVVIQAPGLACLYHAGDTDVFSDMKLIDVLYSPKIIMLPIGDLYTMGPKAAAIAARYFNPAAIIPIHHGTFPVLTGTVQEFKGHLGPELAKHVVALKPGESALWNADGASA